MRFRLTPRQHVTTNDVAQIEQKEAVTLSEKAVSVIVLHFKTKPSVETCVPHCCIIHYHIMENMIFL